MLSILNQKRLNFNLRLNEQHPFHLVDISPWPLMTSISLFSLALSFVMYFHYFAKGAFFLVLVCLFYVFTYLVDFLI